MLDLSPSLLLQGSGTLQPCPPIPAPSQGIDSGVAVNAVSHASKNNHIFLYRYEV